MNRVESRSSRKGLLEKHPLLVGLSVMLSVVLVYIAGIHLIRWRFDSWEIRGLFGDMSGAVNTLFSGLAFAGVICAILLQKQELALQREELRATREELHRTAEAQERSEKALREQVQAFGLNAQLTGISALANVRKVDFDVEQVYKKKSSMKPLEQQIETMLAQSGITFPPRPE